MSGDTDSSSDEKAIILAIADLGMIQREPKFWVYVI